MRYLLLCFLFLTACNPQTFFEDSATTASGAVQDVKDQAGDLMQKGKTLQEGVTEMVDDAKKRINQVQEGVDMMIEGKEMIEGGVKGEE
tara:strand:+ start:140 stop:406 length:267 start_codon:yes stop_codon:yes gene_type:complete